MSDEAPLFTNRLRSNEDMPNKLLNRESQNKKGMHLRLVERGAVCGRKLKVQFSADAQYAVIGSASEG